MNDVNKLRPKLLGVKLLQSQSQFHYFSDMGFVVEILFLMVVSKWLEKREEKQRREEERGKGGRENNVQC